MESKAIELIEKFIPYTMEYQEGTDMQFSKDLEAAKECAIICCDQVIENIIIDTNLDTLYMFTKEYWEGVKIEISEIK